MKLRKKCQMQCWRNVSFCAALIRRTVKLAAIVSVLFIVLALFLKSTANNSGHPLVLYQPVRTSNHNKGEQHPVEISHHTNYYQPVSQRKYPPIQELTSEENNAKYQPIVVKYQDISENPHPFQIVAQKKYQPNQLHKISDANYQSTQTKYQPIQDMPSGLDNNAKHQPTERTNRQSELDKKSGSNHRPISQMQYQSIQDMLYNNSRSERNQPVNFSQRSYQPIHEIPYSIDGSNSDRAVFVVPRRAYYDNRLEAGKPRNSVIITAEVHNDAVSTILACELSGHLSTSLKVEKENNGWILANRPQYTHCAVVIQCIGLPQDAIFNGSVAKLIYKKRGESHYSRVECEKPLLLHVVGGDPSTPTKGKGSVVVCAAMFGHPGRFDQWLMYHEYLGVERVHVNAEASFAKNIQFYPFLKQSLSNGFAHMEVWNDIIGGRIFYYDQKLKYEDCLYRYIGVFEYGLFYDYDDFFNPIIPDQKDIHYYFSKFFYSNQIGTVCMPWRQMECGPVEKLVKDCPHGNLTSILSGYEFKLRKQVKCAHRLSAPNMVSVHRVLGMLPNYIETLSPHELAYVAHNRVRTKPCIP